jgi:hypothetical protein
MSVHVQRAIAVLVTAIAIGIPLLNLAPKLYLWFLHDHIRKLYRRLRTVEEALQKALTVPQVTSHLDDIDRAARILPQRNSDLFLISTGTLSRRARSSPCGSLSCEAKR